MLIRLGRMMNAGQPTSESLIENNASLIPLATPLTVIGDSQTYGDFRAKSYIHWLNLALSGRLFVPQTVNRGTANAYGANAGVGGQTSAQIAARAAAFNTHDGIYILLMGQNDNAGVSAPAQQANFETIFAELSGAARIYVIPFAQTASVAANGAIQARNATNKAWLAGIGATYPNVVLLPDSVWSGIALHDGSGGAGAQSFDGTHPNVNGAWRLGSNIAALIGPDLAAGDAYGVIAALGFENNLYAADFSGTGGSVGAGAAGQAATGLALTVSNTAGLTVTASKGTLEGKDSQIITIAGTSGAGTIFVRLRETAAHTFDVNDAFFMCGRIRITASDGVSAPAGLQAVGSSPAGGRHPFISYFSPASENGALFAFEGIFVCTPETNASGAGTLSSDTEIRIAPETAVDLRFEIADVKIYNQTQELTV